MPTLIWRKAHSGAEQRFSLTRRITSIGSSAQNDIVMDAPEIEANHALIQFDGQRFVLQRLSRSAPLWVNGKKAKRLALDHHDEITLGNETLEFHLFDTQDVSQDDGPVAEPAPHKNYQALLEFSERLLVAQDVNTLLEQMMDAIIELTHAEKGFLLIAEDDGSMRVRVARAMDAESVSNQAALYSDSIVQTVIRTQETLIVSDALRDAQFSASESVVNFNLCSVLCAPLLYRGELIGLIYVGNDRVANLFQPEDRDTLTLFSGHAALIVRNAILMQELRDDNRALKAQLENIKFGSVIGASEAMRTIYQQIERVAPTDISILIDGETGTGKELIAHEIHARSSRADGPFISINCGAIPEALLESELFGHTRGAFTGANQARDGRFQAAHGGTLFLDEIGEMPLPLQVKILRALQERVVVRVGDHKEQPVDIRILAATNRNLEQEVHAGRFREDLYYRLHVIQLTLPPLRERGEDILLIGQYLLDRYIKEYGTPQRIFGAQAKQAMRDYAWPGNIRELDNHIKKAVILAEARELTPQDLGLRPAEPAPIQPLQDAKEAWQRSYIESAVIRCNGNRSEAARELGIDPRTIYRYLKEDASDERS